MEARKAARNLETLNENGDEQEDFLECKPHTFSGTEGVVELSRYDLTWWNSYTRTIGVNAAYSMKWVGLMKLMTEVYCPRNEIHKMETELWNMTRVERFIRGFSDNIQGNVIAVNPARLQDAICIANQLMDKKIQGYATRSAENRRRMESNPKDNQRFIGGLPDNIQGNVITVNPAKLQDAIRIANQLMDKKLQGYATRSAENKRRMESNPRDNRGQQPPFKRQNTTGRNVARA
nr:hypothetical protein [Tanacetum cinerariifolium]